MSQSTFNWKTYSGSSLSGFIDQLLKKDYIIDQIIPVEYRILGVNSPSGMELIAAIIIVKPKPIFNENAD